MEIRGKSHKKVKVDEVLFYSGAMPKTLKDKPGGRLIARITADSKMVRHFECATLSKVKTSLIDMTDC